MKALNLIESINNVLNEDAYSKFTVEQLYKKLGPEGLMKYVKGILSSGLKRIKNITPIKDEIPDLSQNKFTELFWVEHSRL